MLSLWPFDFSVGVGGFIIGLSQLSSFSPTPKGGGGRNQVFGRVGVPFRHATLVADTLWILIFGVMSDSVKTLSPVLMSKTDIMSHR